MQSTADSVESLLSRYRSGDSTAFREVYRRTKRLVYAFLRRRLRQTSDVEDVFQETYLRVHKYIATYDATRGGIAWILSIARHAMLTRASHLKKNPVVADAASTEELASVESAAETVEIKSLLTDLCRGLTPDEIDLLYQRVFLDVGFDELAARGKTSEVNARQRISRLMRKLRSNLSS